MLAHVVKAPAKFDCLKQPSVLALENLEYTPFHLIALLLFAAAIIHTLSVRKIHHWARSLEIYQAPHRTGKRTERSIPVQILYFLSEVEIIFGIWVIPLFFAMAYCCGFDTALGYINTRDFTEPLFVVIILCLSMTRPIVECSEQFIHFLAKGLGGTLSAWWFTLLTVAPLLGSFITEAGAMAIAAMLLSRKFYEHRPSQKLAYTTIALLFVNISVGGLLTNFASPAVLILSHSWNWSNSYVFFTFGWKAALGIILSNLLYWHWFRDEFDKLNKREVAVAALNPHHATEEKPVPRWIAVTHLLFMAVIVMTSHYPAIFIATFLFFIGFHQSTRPHQSSLKLARPLLVGLFLAGLVIHGGLQGWWVVDLFLNRSPLEVLAISIGLTPFNDNAAISYLATLIPNWGELYKYAIFTGVVAGGGLTVIANAPNPAGYVILSKHFEGGVSPLKLFIAALLPTFIMYAIFTIFSGLLNLF